ncbi:MAG TPA: D-alanyl-D-alanine carboxypeptidase family protein [Ktedonobacterales bacterium]|nr:D-alanyl-D-alanine carboxypeptidase family protein [Ktedonobacterales bacterium]
MFVPRITSPRRVSAPTTSSPSPHPGRGSAGTERADDGAHPVNDLARPLFSSLQGYVPAAGLQPPAVQAAAAFLFDPERGLVFYEKHADDQRSIASLTKVMTLVLAVNAGNLDRPIHIGPDAAALVSSANSYMGVSSGERLTLRDLLYGLVVGSGNDAAVAIADGISETQATFVALMNSRARRFGLTQTHFVTPDGVDNGNLSTAHDLAILTAIALMTPGVEHITSTRHTTIPTTGTHKAFELWSSNDLLPGGRAPYPGANGVKSGYTERASYCLAFSARRQGHLLVGVLLGDPSADARDRDAHALLDWGFAQE